MEPVLLRLVLVLALVALVTVAGLLWRRRDGRLTVPSAAPDTGPAQGRRGTTNGGLGAAARPGPPAADDGGQPAFDEQQLAAVGIDLAGDDVRAGAVLLTSPTCAPCATVKRILGELADARADVRWVAVEAADHLDLARSHHVMRVPTLFLLDRRGRIIARTSGVPARADLERVIDREALIERRVS